MKEIKNNKGFSLVELIAVIVILAIIAVITVPSILTQITNSRLNAAKDSALSVLRATENAYANMQYETSVFKQTETYTYSCNGTTCSLPPTTTFTDSSVRNLDITGTIPKSGEITAGTSGFNITKPLELNSGYKCTGSLSSGVTCTL